MRHAFRICVAGIKVCLYFGPIVTSPPIAKGRARNSKRASFDCLDPGGMRKTEIAGAFDKSVTFVVITLHRVPIMKFSWH
jgi:hypothetical protein